MTDYTLTPAADLKPGDEIRIEAEATVADIEEYGFSVLLEGFDVSTTPLTFAELAAMRLYRKTPAPPPVTISEMAEALRSLGVPYSSAAFRDKAGAILNRYDAEQPAPEVPAGALIATAGTAEGDYSCELGEACVCLDDHRLCVHWTPDVIEENEPEPEQWGPPILAEEPARRCPMTTREVLNALADAAD